jgi:multiple sugar transport system permease protein
MTQHVPIESSARPVSRQRMDKQGLLFALPHLLLFTTFILAPVLYGFFVSMHQWHILAKEHPFVGVANYKAALSDDIFWLALRNTVYFVVLAVPLGNLVSLGLALCLAQVRRFGTFYKVAYYVPVIISISVVAVLWRWMYSTEIGLINLYIGAVVGGLQKLGLPLPPFEPLPWLSNPSWVMPSIAILTVWWTAGGNMMIFLAGLNNISPDYYEAASLDGASPWQKFRSITWPLLRPTTLFCLVFSLLGAFQVFGQSYVLFTSVTGGSESGPARSGLTMALYMYLQGFRQYEIGYGTSIAYLLFAIVLILTALQFRLMSGRPEDSKG